MSENIDKQVLLQLGEVTGELKSLRHQIAESGASTAKSIDDLGMAINRRIDDGQRSNEIRFSGIDERCESIEARVETIENKKNTSPKKAFVVGSGTGAIAVALIETLRTFLTP